MLRDRLVCGLQNRKLQQRLLSEPELTFKKDMDLAQVMETAEQNVQDLRPTKTLKNDSHSSEKTAIQTAQIPERGGFKCYRCGGTHLSKVCSFKDAECHYCKKRGHIAKVCQYKAKANSQKFKTHQFTAEEDEDESPDYYFLRTASKVSEPIF